MSFDPKKMKTADGPPARHGRLRSELTITLVDFARALPPDGTWMSYELPGVDPAKMGQALNTARKHLGEDVKLEYATYDGVVTVYGCVQPF